MSRARVAASRLARALACGLALALVAVAHAASPIDELKQRAEAGDREAQFRLGNAYDGGHGVPRDSEEARKWYLRSAEAGYAEAQNSVGSILQAEKRYGEARAWYERAAAQGHALATNNLAYLYDLGLGVTQDRRKGFELYSRAADMGWAESMWNLANMYGAGQLGPVDMDMACVWTLRTVRFADPRERARFAQAYRTAAMFERQFPRDRLSACKEKSQDWSPPAMRAAAAEVAPATDVAPTGVLRVAIGVGPSPSAFWAVKDPSTGEPKGVTVELGKAAAKKLGVPLKLVEYPNSGEITAAASQGAWDISFMPADPAREKFIDPGPAYVTYVTTYIVRAGSTIRNAAEVDQPGMRVGGVEGTATSRALQRTLKQAKLVLFNEAEEGQAELAQGKLDALAQGREALLDLAKKAPGTRVLDDPIVSTSVIVVVPKDRPATRAWAERFLEDAKSDGTVRRALDSAGFHDAAVAPPKS